MPFRSWCEHCVKGRAKAGRHETKKTSDARTIPVVSVDYMWMKSRESGDESRPIVVAVDSRTRYTAAWQASEKGPTEYSVRKLNMFIQELGYRK